MATPGHDEGVRQQGVLIGQLRLRPGPITLRVDVREHAPKSMDQVLEGGLGGFVRLTLERRIATQDGRGDRAR